MTSSRDGPRAGMTLIELLIALALIGVMLALLVPAVQQVRAVARMAGCRSNLRQVGIATANYLSVYQTFPGGRESSVGCLYALLPFMDQQPVFQRAEAIFDPKSRSASIPAIAAYKCPDDPTTQSSDVASYLVNKGLLPAVGPVRGFVFEPVRQAAVIDGFSHTAFCSESITNAWRPRYLLLETAPPLRRTRDELRQLSVRCAASLGTLPPHSIGGRSPSVLAAVDGYNHLLPPNMPPCLFTPYPVDVKPPVGGHPGGLNVLYADGSVRFTSDNIDRETWWSLGTIDARDLASDG